MYLAWYDSSPKKPAARKVAEAAARYREKFAREPLVCLINPAEVVEGAEVELRPLAHIARNCFWIGRDDPQE